MEEGEFIVMVISVILAIVGLCQTSTARMPKLYFREASGLGMVRVAHWLALAWIAWVIWNKSDPSVVGIYRWFYLVMGFAVVRITCLNVSRLFGARFRADVVERHNPAAATLYAALVLGTGWIFGGCLWGEADPDGSDEGGWWIPLGFFLAGWTSLIVATALFYWREPGPTRKRIRRDRSVTDAEAAAVYVMASAIALTQAVAGDFYGWRHGLLAVGWIIFLLVVREIFGLFQDKVMGRFIKDRRRGWETATYALSSLILFGLSRSLENWLQPSL